MDDVELGSASLEIGKMDKQPTHVRDHHWWVAFPVLRQHCSEDVYVGVYIQQERAVKIWVALDSGTHQRIPQAGERLFLLQPPAPLHIFLYKDVQRNCHVCEIPDIPPVIGGQPQELPYLLHAPGRGLLLNSLSSPDHSTDCRRDSTPFKHSRGSSSVLWKTIISSRWTRHVFHVRPFSAFSISLKRRRSVPQPEQYDPKSQQSHGSGKRRLLALSFGDFDLPVAKQLILRWSTQNRREPSFFQASTTGEHKGPKAGSFALVCIIFQINQFTVSRLDGGRRRGGNLTGCAPPVSMRGWLRFIRLTSAAPHEMTFLIRI
ncbi:hypothetical protein T4B_3978 [Trichinella pseudospiralis]|uniref:Uncharacterized protein n=1 Tax=Trichinella pseudospiralis TaxID=6337 RepID=A0A0V1JB51_TRIPS|nr:hypothetical protein T4B_3978 [Trichinella pseudospiralis]